jgi:hypothetical protein
MSVEVDCKTEDGQPCDTLEGRMSNCTEVLCYSYTIDNLGTRDLGITVFNRTSTINTDLYGRVIDFDVSKAKLVEKQRYGMVEDLLPEITVNPLPPGVSAVIEEKFEVDLCGLYRYAEARKFVVVAINIGNVFSAGINVEAGPGCSDEDGYGFKVEYPFPDCYKEGTLRIPCPCDHVP